jgi:hypothetical protein
LIPADSPFRKTFLENIELHREIQVAYGVHRPRHAPRQAGSRSRQARAR